MTDSVTENEELELGEEAPDDAPASGEADDPSHPGRDAEAPRGDGVSEDAAWEGLESEEGAQEPAEQGDAELAALRAEFETLNDRHLRLAAEFNNFRRRSEQERLAAWGRAQAELLEKLLDVLDDLQRVAELDLSSATVEAIMDGIDLVERKFGRALEDASVEVIDPIGEPFDPERMEAMMRVPAQSEEHQDTVAQVFQKGYALKGILIRAARVSVYMEG